MTDLRNSAEGGTNGSTVTTGNSGGASGNAFQTIAAGTGNSLTYDTGSAVHGLLGYLFTKVGSPPPSSIVQLLDSGGGAAAFAARVYINLASLPGADAANLGMQPRSTADAQLGSCIILSSGLMRLSGPSGTLLTGTVPVSAPNIIRLEMQGLSVGTASTQYLAQVFIGDSATSVDNLTSGTFTTAAQMDRIRFGNTGAGTIASYGMDEMAFTTGSSTAIGSVVDPLLPVAYVQSNPSYAAMRSVW